MKTKINNIIAEIKNELKSHHSRLDFYYDKAIRAAENGNFLLLLDNITRAEKAISSDPLLQKLDTLYRLKKMNISHFHEFMKSITGPHRCCLTCRWCQTFTPPTEFNPTCLGKFNFLKGPIENVFNERCRHYEEAAIGAYRDRLPHLVALAIPDFFEYDKTYSDQLDFGY